MIFQVEVFESTSRVETIEAETREDALSKVKKAYERGDIRLSEENAFMDVSFNIV
jgi:hypothetical protein